MRDSNVQIEWNETTEKPRLEFFRFNNCQIHIISEGKLIF